MADFTPIKPVEERPRPTELIKQVGQVQKIIKYVVIFACIACCGALLYTQVLEYLKYGTIVNVNVKFMRKLRDILPGITVCSNMKLGLYELGKLNKAVPVKIKEIESMNVTDEEKYRAKNKFLKSAISEIFDPLPLSEYFKKELKMSTVKNVLEDVECDRQTWQKGDGRYVKYSLPDICYNIFKTRTIEKSGSCITLFHEAALVFLDLANAARTDDSYFVAGKDSERKRDKEALAMISTGKYSPPLFPENALLEMTLNYNREDSRRPNQSTNLELPYGGKFWVHSNREIPKMSSLGFELYPGRKYTIYVKKDITLKMKPPYSTVCRDYKEEYMRNIRARNIRMDLQVPMSQDTCIAGCIANKAILDTANCGCWPSVLPFRMDNNTEDRLKLKWCPPEKECFMRYEAQCSKNCSSDCREEYYEVLIKEMPHPSPQAVQKMFDTTKKSRWTRIYRYNNFYQPVTKVEVIFRSTEETYYKHEPAMELINFLVDIAGLLGLFLGLSFIYFVDLFDMLYSYCARRHKAGANQKES